MLIIICYYVIVTDISKIYKNSKNLWYHKWKKIKYIQSHLFLRHNHIFKFLYFSYESMFIAKILASEANIKSSVSVT